MCIIIHMSPSPNQVSSFLRRLHLALEEQNILVEVYALDRAAEELGWDHTAILEELRWLAVADFLKCQSARNPRYRNEVIWVFRPDRDPGTVLGTSYSMICSGFPLLGIETCL